MSRVALNRNLAKFKNMKTTQRRREAGWAFGRTGARGSLGQQQPQGSSVVTGTAPSDSMENQVRLLRLLTTASCTQSRTVLCGW